MPGHTQRVLPETDVELARKLLADAGYPGGAGLPVLNLYVPPWFARTERIVESWRELGARVEMVVERMSVFRHLPEGAHMWLTGFIADYPDPDGFFRGILREPSHLVPDEELEEALEEARALRDPAERIRRYIELDRLLVAERAAFVPIAYRRSLILRRSWVERLPTHPMTGMALDRASVGPKPARRAAAAVGRTPAG